MKVAATACAVAMIAVAAPPAHAEIRSLTE
jgi:hypothetical protein